MTRTTVNITTRGEKKKVAQSLAINIFFYLFSEKWKIKKNKNRKWYFFPNDSFDDDDHDEEEEIHEMIRNQMNVKLEQLDRSDWTLMEY